MDFIQRVVGMFTKPDETMKDIVKEPRIEEALIIVGVYIVITLIAGYISSLHMVTGTGSDIIGLVLRIIIALALWPIITGILHLFALMLGGEGKYNPNMLTAIGYTNVIKIIPAIVAMLLVLFTPVVTIPMTPGAIPTAEDMTNIVNAYKTYLFNPFFLLSFVVGFIGILWSCYLGMLAVKNGEKLSMVTSAIVVGVPLLIYLVLIIGLTFGSIFLYQMAASAL